MCSNPLKWENVRESNSILKPNPVAPYIETKQQCLHVQWRRQRSTAIENRTQKSVPVDEVCRGEPRMISISSGVKGVSTHFHRYIYFQLSHQSLLGPPISLRLAESRYVARDHPVTVACRCPNRQLLHIVRSRKVPGATCTTCTYVPALRLWCLLAWAPWAPRVPSSSLAPNSLAHLSRVKLESERSTYTGRVLRSSIA